MNKGILKAVVCLLIAVFLILCVWEKPDSTEYGISLIPATVVRVVDGDTIVAAINGEETKIRMIGIDCPESVSPDESKNCEEGKIASEFTKSRLPENMKIYIQPGVEDTDKYGRMLAYIWTENVVSPASEEDVRNYMFNAVLLANGMAKTATYEPNTQYAYLFYQIQLEKEDTDNGR